VGIYDLPKWAFYLVVTLMSGANKGRLNIGCPLKKSNLSIT